ncbi:MAG: helicase, partial [Alistipes sp.]|nr:helicase [Alistipes sp.]
SSNVKTEFYLATPTGVEIIDFLEAVKYLKAKPEELPVPFENEEQHYKHVNSALAQYTTEYVEAADTSSINRTDLDKTSLEANKFLRTIKQITTDSELKSQCDVLMRYINEGIYAQLPRSLKAWSREYKNDRAKMKQEEHNLSKIVEGLLKDYQTMNKEQRHDAQDISNPQIIISESFK